MRDDLRALVLGIVQGLTEFIPVSSSGHLILVPALFGWPDQGLAFDAGLHLGTAIAVLIYFRRDILEMARSLLGDVAREGLHPRAYRTESRLGLYIVAASVPVAVIGLLAADAIEERAREPWNVAIALAAVAVVFLVVERIARRDRGFDSITLRDAMIVGLAQAAALVPGVSRSGATISAAMAIGLRRDEAARFAFLLGAPATLGAGLFAARDLAADEATDWSQVFIGGVSSMVVGLVAIHWLLRFLRVRSLVPFAGYRLAIAVAALVIGAMRVN